VAVPLSVLIIAEAEAEAESIAAELARGGFAPEWQRVATEPGFLDRLRPGLELILASGSESRLEPRRALRLWRKHGLGAAFVVVNGAPLPEAAAACLGLGASGYLQRGSLGSLGPTVARALDAKEPSEQAASARSKAGAPHLPSGGDVKPVPAAPDQTQRQNDDAGLQGLLDDIPLCIDIVGPDGDVLFINRAMRAQMEQQLWGARCSRERKGTREECAGCALLGPTLPDEASTIEVCGTLGGRVFEITSSETTYSGSPAVMEVFQDVTQRKRLEGQLHLQTQALEAAANAVVITDGRGTILWVNPAFSTLTGYAAKEVVGRTPAMWKSGEQGPAFYRALWSTLSSGRAWRGELVNRRKDGSLYTEEMTLTPVRERGQEVTHFIAIKQDIGERKQRHREQQAIVTVAAALRKAPTRTQMLPVILDQLLELLGADGAAVAMCPPGEGDNVIELARGRWESWTGIRIPASKGITGHVIDTGEPYRTDDVRREPRILRPELFEDHPAVACVPLITQKRTIGAVWVGRTAPISEVELRLLRAVGDMAANAIHRATLHEQTERRLKRLEALASIDRAINANLDLRMTLDVLLDQVVSQLGVDAAEVMLSDPYDHTLELAAARGFRSRAVERTRLRPGEGLAGRVALERRSTGIVSLGEAGDFTRGRLLGEEEFEAYCGIPLLAKGQVGGVLGIFHRSPLAPEAEWFDFLETLADQAATAIDNARLFERLQRSNLELELAYDATIEGWSRALDLRDEGTEGHTQRVAEMTLQLARALGIRGEELVHVRRGALLHDIGKMGVPDAILLKPGPLSDDEWAIMRRHPTYAYEMLSPIAYLRPALEIPHCHHERWDGTGYPRGLRGEEIPFAARIFAVVDVWDALLSDRPYRAGWPLERVREHVQEHAGSHFDLAVAALALELWGVGGATDATHPSPREVRDRAAPRDEPARATRSLVARS